MCSHGVVMPAMEFQKIDMALVKKLRMQRRSQQLLELSGQGRTHLVLRLGQKTVSLRLSLTYQMA